MADVVRTKIKVTRMVETVYSVINVITEAKKRETDLDVKKVTQSEINELFLKAPAAIKEAEKVGKAEDENVRVSKTELDKISEEVRETLATTHDDNPSVLDLTFSN